MGWRWSAANVVVVGYRKDGRAADGVGMAGGLGELQNVKKVKNFLRREEADLRNWVRGPPSCLPVLAEPTFCPFEFLSCEYS